MKGSNAIFKDKANFFHKGKHNMNRKKSYFFECIDTSSYAKSSIVVIYESF